MKRKHERGALLVMTALVLPLAIGVCGLALELSMAFQRQSQLQQVADTVALSAAQQLDGSASGIVMAGSAASVVVANRQVRGVGRVWLNTAVLSFAAGPGRPLAGIQCGPGRAR